jgi:hypothetical protein
MENTTKNDTENNIIIDIEENKENILIEFASIKEIDDMPIYPQPNVEIIDDDLQTNMYQSNSPITMSETSDNEMENSDNSDYNSGSDDELLKAIRTDRIRNQVHSNNHQSFRLKSYNDIEKSLSKYYEEDSKYSSKMDILITFMKGQKNIFTQSKYITEKKLNCLMIPILIFSAGMAVFAPFIQNYNWSGGFISGLNIIITTFVSMMNYMKYETHVEMYLQLANHYDKMEISIEMTNSQLLFIENEKEKNDLVLSKIKEIEIKINELKEVYNILLPREIKHMFPIICNLNILSLIKKMENYRKSLIHKFKDVKNEIRYILYKWKKENQTIDNAQQTKEKKRLIFLYEIKEQIKDEFIESKKIYDYVEDVFTKEIKNAEYNIHLWFWCCWNKKSINKNDIHPLLNKHFHFIFEDL